MRRRTLLLAALATNLAVGQTPTSQANSSALDLLARVSRRYKEAKSYYIESLEERSSTGEYHRNWERTFLVAGAAPGDRYHYEGRSGFSHAVRVSDGSTLWTYHVDDLRYTSKPQSSGKTGGPGIIPMAEMSLVQAENLQKRLGDLAKPFKAAEQLRDAVLKQNGRKVRCYVIRLRSADQKRPSPGYSFEKKLWIDKSNLTVLRIVEHARSTVMIPGSTGIPTDEDSTTVFSSTVLDRALPENLFRFVPPPQAKLIDDFPDPRTGYFGSMVGLQAPLLKLKSGDGRATSLDSFRGKPVLIDFWATWCPPCVSGLAKLDKIYHEGADKGLVVISVDRDEEAKTAGDFLAKKGYTWPNFHDEGDIETLVGSSGIPRAFLIDAQGKVVYDGTGTDDDALRAQIAKLGPDYLSLAPAKPSGCTVSD